MCVRPNDMCWTISHQIILEKSHCEIELGVAYLI
jgi:hypothetical protein